MLTALLVAAAVAPAPAPIRLGDSETIVFLGDSITQQNLYTAYIESFLISRLPGRRLVFWNVGVGGNTVADGLARFEHDVAPLHPTMVVVNFGMNDGKYVPPDPVIREKYVAGLRTLVDKIAGLGARAVLCTPSAVARHQALYLDPYNETLAGLSEGVREIAAERHLPVIDLFVATRAQAEREAPVLIPDGVHPGEAGHMLLAHPALMRFDVPRGLGQVVVTPQGATAPRTVTIRAAKTVPGRVSFDMTPAFLPAPVPEDARVGAALVKFGPTLNTFSMAIRGWPGARALLLTVDGQELAVLSPAERADIDLTALDAAPWVRAGQALWREAGARYKRHLDAWRPLDIDASPFLRGLSTRAVLIEAERAFVREAGESLRTLVAPRTYHVALEDSDEVPVRFVELSPTYPFDLSAADFETRHAPETAPDTVAWRKAALTNREIDLARELGQPKKSVVYVRLMLDATAAGDATFSLGSNDGLTVFVNGQRLLARNVSRTVKLGDETLTVPLTKGRNVCLFRVTQHELRHGLALKIRAPFVVSPIPPR